MNDVKGMDILKKLGFGTMRLPVDENEDINYELIGQMVDIFVRNGFTYFDTAYGYMGGACRNSIKKLFGITL